MNVSSFPFPAGVFPALLCQSSVTTLAYKAEGIGLVRYQWLDGEPGISDRQVLDVNCVTKAHAKLSFFGQARHCAYFVDHGSKMLLATVNIDAPTNRIYYPLELQGNDPIAWWGDELYAQTFEASGYRIRRGTYPVQPHEDMGPGAATGIAWVDDETGVPALWDTVRPPAFPHGYQFSRDGAVWVTHDDQIVLQIGTVQGTLPGAPKVFNPVIAKQTNGRFVVAAWTRTSSGPGALYVAADIAASDLVPMEPALPEPKIDPYGRALPHFWYYTLDADKGYGDYYEEILDACWCATESDVAKANEQGVYVIAGADKIRKAMKPAMVMVSNDFAGAPSLEESIDVALPVARELNVGMVIVDELDWHAFPPNIPDGAVLGFKAFREPNETAMQTLERLLPITVRCQTEGHRVCWVLGADDRLRRLTDFQISETLKTLTSVFAELSNVAIVGAFSYARRGLMPDGRPTGGALLHPNAAQWIKASRKAGGSFSWSDYRLTSAPDEPEPPEEPTGMNVYLLVTPAGPPPANKVPPPGNTKLLGERVNQSDGSFGIKKPNGKYATLNPSGGWEERDAVLGHWEKFYDGKPGFVLAPRHDENGAKCYTLEAVQGP